MLPPEPEPSPDAVMPGDPERPGGHRIALPGDPCPNCGARLHGQWCHTCGQNQKSIHRLFLALVAEAFEDVFSFNSRTARTFSVLLFRPGKLAMDFVAGRRARYLPPLRLYLVTSVAFFFLLSVQNMLGETRIVQLPQGETAEVRAPWDSQLSLDLPFISAEHSAAIQQRLSAQLEKLNQLAREDPGELVEAMLEVVPPAVFLLLPLFALLLRIFYFSFGFYYSEHLVLAVTNHSFLFTVLFVEIVLSALPDGIWALGTLRLLLLLWIPAYMYLSLKNVYGQGYTMTMVNFLLLGLSYVVLLVLTIALAMLLGLMTL